MLSGLKSSTFGPSGGMTFPPVLERGTSGLSEMLRPTKQGCHGPGFDTTILEEDSPIKTQLANRAAMDFEPFIEPENNEDQKSPGYPDGPIAIYEDNVYLYLEPTAEEASKFDVVINVAREVLNPFEAVAKNNRLGNHKALQLESPIPDTAMTNDSFATAFEYPPSSDHNMTETPTTPKGTSFSEPEYIHMPWEHNTDIATDLMMLCETIERRTKDGKKVLVHCQQGASRSASLIIAYGLYQNPGLTVNDAYYAAQSKSRWISPNMRLMYCLQDFQKEVSKKLPRSAAGPRSGRSPTKHRLTLSANAIEFPSKEPLTAPLPDDEQGSGNSLKGDRGQNHSRGKSSPNLGAISPGPSSAPSTFSWSEKEDENDPGKPGRFNFGNSLEPPRFFEPLPAPAVVEPSRALRPPPTPSFFKPPPSPAFFQPPPTPGFGPSHFGHGPQHFGFSSLNFGQSGFGPSGFGTEEHGGVGGAGGASDVEVVPASPDDDALMSPRAETMTNNPLHDSYTEMTGLKFVESPPTPNEGLFSPRQTMFPRDPFLPFGRPSQVADPRSPPTKGETPIVRSIDDVL